MRRSPVLRRFAALDEDAKRDVQEVLSDIAYFDANGNPDTLERIIEGIEILEEYDIDLGDVLYRLEKAKANIDDAMTEAFMTIERAKSQLQSL
jgi:hypothetical protein